MKHQSVLWGSVILMLALTLLMACQTTPSPPIEKQTEEIVATSTVEIYPQAANAATAIAEKENTTWQMVIVGDSLVAADWSSLPEQYAEAVSKDLGIEIQVTNLGSGGLTCASFLPNLKKYSFNRGPIRNGDIILVSLGGSDLLMAGEKYFKDDCDGAGGDICLKTALTEFQSCWDEFLQELTTLANSKENLIRIIIPGAFFQKNEDQAEKYVPYLKFQDEFYAYQIQTSEGHGITVLDIYHFEEPAGFRMGDNIHVSQEGKEMIVTRLRDLGYDYSQQK